MATEAHVTHRALDGRRFQLSGQLDLSQPFTSAVSVTVGGRVHELTAGPIGLGEEIARANGVERFDEVLSFQGGSLRIGHARHFDAGIRLVEDMLVAVWEGLRHCLVLSLYRATTLDVVGLLRTLRITEHSDGIALKPDAKAGCQFADRATVTKQVPGLGLLEVSSRTVEHARALPDWQGVTTTAGELFQDTLSDGNPYFVLAGADTWATVMPLADTRVGQLPAVADRLALRTVS
jgi:hypothetical protein